MKIKVQTGITGQRDHRSEQNSIGYCTVPDYPI